MFKVVWTIGAQDDLWRVVESCDDRTLEKIGLAMRSVDGILSGDPAHAGESRDLGRRVLLIDPLTAFFRVYPDESLVRVLGVQYWGR